MFPINAYFIYQSSDTRDQNYTKIWQDNIYTHSLAPSSDIVLVTIDDDSINTLQTQHNGKMLTIPKSVYTRVVDILTELGVKGIAFDIVFQNPDETEDEFVEAMKRHGNVVLATTNPKTGDTVCRQFGNGTYSCSETPLSVYSSLEWGLIEHTPESRLPGFDMSKNSELARTILAQKFAGKSITPSDTWIYTLPLALLDNTVVEQIAWAKNRSESPVLNPYFGGNGSYRIITLRQLLNGGVEAFGDSLQGKYVLIGEDGKLFHDVTLNPVDNTLMPGVESHAHFLDGILQDKLLSHMSKGTYFFLLIISAITSIVLYYFLPKYLSPFAVALILVANIWITRYAYDQHRVVIDIFPLFLASGLLTYPITYIYRFFVTDRERRFILSTFSRYLSPEVVHRINTDEISAKLGGEKRELSVLFSDIEGFTTISEKLDPKELFGLITTYLNHMTAVLTKNKGTLDKYIGDAVMGFFGAPVDDEQHAISACMTAIDMKKSLALINEEIAKLGMNPINFRVGIASGEVMVGNIGSEERFSYTVLGDTVNLASRLEAIGKEYDVRAVISADTRIAIGDAFIVRELDYIAVKGKTEAVRIFELIDTKDSGIDTSIYAAYEAALKVYRDGQYLQAGKIWEQYMQVDPPSRIMALRCVALLKGETRLDNGVYRMEHK